MTQKATQAEERLHRTPTTPNSANEPIFRIEVTPRMSADSTVGSTLVRAAHQLGVTTLKSCTMDRLFFLRGNLSAAQVDQLAQELLVDPVTETFSVAQQTDVNPSAGHTVEVTLLPGVTDPAAENLLRAAHLLGLNDLSQAATGQRYRLTGPLDPHDLHQLAANLFSNPVIQQVALNAPVAPPFVPYRPTGETVEIIPLKDASDETLLNISATRRLALNLIEMQAIRDYYRQEGRNPTDVELEMLAQTWSEHCVHKTFKATIHYTGPPPSADPNAPLTALAINGLLKTYIRAATEQVNKPWIRSAFVDNAGIIDFDDAWDLAFKVETHNHPSALEPFGGANTGVGGVVRDVLGVSARPIANTNVLCFGPTNLPEADLPDGLLHPRRIVAGVVHGIEDYGNKMGIPTVNGAILYHPDYTANPLVFCGCLGLLPKNSHPTTPQPDDLIVAIGGRTGRDGLRGATFSSMEMDQSTGQVAGSAVQIGHPIHEKQVLEVILQARNEQLYHAITDCGAGGFSSAVGEMAQPLGAEIQLETVPLKYPGLQPWEIWLSEAQERMVLAVPPDKWPRLQQICAGQDIEAVSIGHFEATGRLRINYEQREVGDVSLEFLHNGLPSIHLEARWQPPVPTKSGLTPTARASQNATQLLLALLAHPNIRSKEAVIHRYDHEVQGGTAIKPLVGADNHGPGDAAVLIPLDVQERTPKAKPATRRGVALSVGICPAYGRLDPYAMAWAAIDEAMRNLVAVGADPDQVALLDNFCWGNPNLPDRLGSLVRSAQGCYNAAVAFGAPFISGKDSLNNEYTGADGQRHAIPGTLLISALGIVPNVAQTVTMDLKQPGNLLYVVGQTRPELGGSHYNLVSNEPPAADNAVPPRPVPNALHHFRAVHRAIAGGLVVACHDCSEGGLAVTLAEMCLAGWLGAAINLSHVPTGQLSDDQLLFSESLSRFVIEVHPDNAEALESILQPVPLACMGRVLARPELSILGQSGNPVLQANVGQLETAWRGDSRPNGNAAQKTGSAAKRQPATAPAGPPAAAPVKAPRVLILHANGTNRDREAVLACELAGGRPEIVHINRLLANKRQLLNYHMLVVPGGFSYGDDLGAGMLWALDFRHRLGSSVARFVESGRPVLGICNGFQALVKAGLLPGTSVPAAQGRRAVTLAPNHSAQFECRWVYLQPNADSPSLFTQGLSEPIYCPVAHGEGRLAVAGDDVLHALQRQNLHALTYVTANGSPADYPANPNGSVANIAGLCNPAGNVLGLMPHPENHLFPWQHPRRQRGEVGLSGLRLFENGIRRA